MQKIQLNQAIPDIRLAAQTANGEQAISLKDYSGKYIILYFYPKDCTSGCTLESQQFRDYHEQFNQLNAVILGISRDQLKLHQKFITEQQLPFALLSDPEEKFCALFDVIKNKTMYGKPVRGIERSTFVINPDGILIHEWRKVTADGHAEEVLHWMKAYANR